MAEFFELSFLVSVDSLSTANQVIYTPGKGTIRRVTISWPIGCNFLVEAVLRHKRIPFVPTPSVGANEGIALDNYTETITPNLWVDINEPIELYLINHDSSNSHKVSAIVHIEKGDAE